MRQGSQEHVPDAARALALVQRCDDVVVLRAAGNWNEVTSRLCAETSVALGEAPRAVVVDLSGAAGPPDEVGLHRLMDLGRHVRDWPGTAFAVSSPDFRVRSLLRAHPMGLFVHVTPRVDRAIVAVTADEPVHRASLSLEPHVRAARSARDLVSRVCLDWHLAPEIPPACLVVSELVNNAVLHAGTNMKVTLALLDRWLRVAVTDGSSTPPRTRQPDDAGLSGRGLLIVDKISHAWGHLPSADAGKVVWAVLAVHAA